MKFSKFEQTPFYFAVDKLDLNAIKLLLENENLDINFLNTVKSFKGNEVFTDCRYVYLKEEEDYDDLEEEEEDNDDDDSYADNLNKIMESEKLYINKVGLVDFYSTHELNTCKKTALHLAVEKKCSFIIDLILKNKNIDVNVKNDQGKTPFECAKDQLIKFAWNHINL